MDIKPELIHYLASVHLGVMLKPDALDDLVTWVNAENNDRLMNELIDIIKDWKPNQ